MPDDKERDGPLVTRQEREVGEAFGLTPSPRDLAEVMILTKGLVGVVEKQDKAIVLLALLLTYYLASVRQEEITLENLKGFLSQGSFNLGGLIHSFREQKRTAH